MLYSIPAFIAAMLCLVFFCYGDYLKIFPMLGLHSENAPSLGCRSFPICSTTFGMLFMPVVFCLVAIHVGR